MTAKGKKRAARTPSPGMPISTRVDDLSFMPPVQMRKTKVLFQIVLLCRNPRLDQNVEGSAIQV